MDVLHWLCNKLVLQDVQKKEKSENYNTSDDIPLIANEMLMLNKELRKNEKYVITGGVPVGVPGTTNYLSVLKGV